MDSNLLEILVCPICKGPLKHDRAQQRLICRPDRLAFPIRDGIPIMLESEASELSPQELAPQEGVSAPTTPTQDEQNP